MAFGLGDIYLLSILILTIYGLLGLFTLCIYWDLRKKAPGRSDLKGLRHFPRVTVQIPLFNERFVARRVIEKVAALRYPKDRLQIQIVDDSDDDTTSIVSACVKRFQDRGFDICLVRRQERIGYKAGALAAALQKANGEFVAIFDADFLPSPDFLLQTVPYLESDPKLGMVQARWEHVNWDASFITGAQAIALDKHFAVEQAVRFYARYFPKFNGSGGIWRRACIQDSGGWHSGTLCEDLCLSIRATLQGWRFLFLNNLAAPAELPDSILAYKTQQARWAKGSTQCILRHGLQILKFQGCALTGRLYALLAMAGYATSFMLLTLVLTLPILIWKQHEFSPLLIVSGIIGLTQPFLFAIAQKDLHQDWGRRLLHLPSLLILAIGLTPTVARAVLEALIGIQGSFVRTSKDQGTHRYAPPFDSILFLEIFLALYAAAAVALCLQEANYRPIFFFVFCTLGFGSVATLSLGEYGRAFLRRLGQAGEQTQSKLGETG